MEKGNWATACMHVQCLSQLDKVRQIWHILDEFIIVVIEFALNTMPLFIILQQKKDFHDKRIPPTGKQTYTLLGKRD